ncbi:MAG: hypothetical protein PHQ25_05660 [Acidobacteriota bacterium]|nr:hypothetical protein [Acidobacteriota bacterium]MDW3229574.1 hypothetical protein [Acidobacteriota bacterium]
MIKKKVLLLPILILVFLAFNLLLEAELKKVLSIGSNQPDYLFMTVTGVVLDEEGNIYVADAGGSFIRKYNPEGVFIKEVGRYGQGPGEFSNSIGPLLYDGQKLYLKDDLNYRIAVLDKELNIENYIKLKGLRASLAKIDNLFYQISTKPGEPFPQVEIYNLKGDFVSSFFDERPDFFKGRTFSKKDYPAWVMFSRIVMAADRAAEEIAVTFTNPGDKIEIFFYTKEGKFKNKIEMDHLIKYKFSEFRLQFPPKYPKKSDQIIVWSIHYMGSGKILLDYWIVRYELEKAVDEKHYLLVVDRKSGRLLHQELVSNDLKVIGVKDGMLFGAEIAEDIPKVVLYKLDY